MAKESIILELNAETDWDGASLTTLNRDDAIVTGQRYYKFNIAGPHGILAPDLGGLFSPVSAKLIGVGYSSWNPESRGRVIASDATGSFRQEIMLKPTIQYVVVYPGDRLSFLTKDGGRGQIVLVVNELTEEQMAQWGVGHEPFVLPTRFRIIRETGTAFAPSLNNVWQPVFTYDSSTGLMVATDNGIGVIPSTVLGQYPRFLGCYVSIRYAGSNADGELQIVENTTRKAWIAETAMADVKWSAVQYISHDDHIALKATAANAGQRMVCDIELSLCQSESRLRGRYAGGL